MFVANETWDTDTVNVSSNIEVPSGRTQTIPANTTVKFYQSTRLTVKSNGILHADGVHFTSAINGTQPGYWQDIKFEGSNANSWIRNSTINNAVNGMNCYQASPEISRNVIQWNTYGSYCQSSSHPNITDNYINFNTYGIYCTGTCNPYIRHNDITENDSYGVTCLNSSAPKLVGVNGNDPYGANTVCGNGGYGVLVQTNSNPNLGSQSSGYLMGYNDIYSNFSKQVYNSTSNTIQARMNYWGTSNPIPSQLFYGPIVYKPYRTSSWGEVGPRWGRSAPSSPPLVEEYPNDEVQAYLEKAQTLEGEEKYEDAVAIYRYVVDNYGDTTAYGGFSLARLMACRVNQGALTVEKDYLAALTHKYRKGEIAMSALLWQPLVEARAKNDQLALAMCDNLVQTYSGTDLARDAHFEKGTIQLYELNDIEAAKKTFDELAQNYPNDPLVEHIAIILSHYLSAPSTLPKPVVNNNDQIDHIDIPEKYTLAQNYPNPFNPETEIHYQLPEAGPVTLTIYNLLGQIICTLVEKWQPAVFFRFAGTEEMIRVRQLLLGSIYMGCKHIASGRSKKWCWRDELEL